MKLYKIVVFVPETHTNVVREAIGDSGGGIIGNYSHCSFSIKGIGRYKPLAGAKPFIGEVDKMEAVKEERVEFVCPENSTKKILKAIRQVHPYEEIAIDIYPLISEKDLS